MPALLRNAASVFFIASRYLTGKKSKGERYLLGAAAGITLSLIPIMVTLITADGMINGITNRFLELGTGHIQIFRANFMSGEDEGAASFEREARDVHDMPEVRGVWEELDGMGIVLGKNGKKGTQVRCIEPSFLEDEGSLRYLKAVEGEAKLKGASDVLLGAELARQAGVKAGDRLRVMSVRTNETGNFIPRSSLFTVRGIVSSGYHEIDSAWCIIPLETGKKLFSGPLYEPFLVVKVNDPYKDADIAAFKINREAGGFFTAFTWKELQAAQYNSYLSTRQMLLFIMALIILIAAVNVSSATSMLVIERERDIAVFKSFGAGPFYTSAVFLCASFLTAITGVVLGSALGLLLGANINGVLRSLESAINGAGALFNAGKIKILDPDFYLETIPIVIDWETVLFIVLFTVFCALLSSTVPAGRAGRSKPAELLRKA